MFSVASGGKVLWVCLLQCNPWVNQQKTKWRDNNVYGRRETARCVYGAPPLISQGNMALRDAWKMACKYICAPLAGHKEIVKFILNFNLQRGEHFGLGLVVFVATNLWLPKPPDWYGREQYFHAGVYIIHVLENYGFWYKACGTLSKQKQLYI